jgi:hypothetical protein
MAILGVPHIESLVEMARAAIAARVIFTSF